MRRRRWRATPRAQSARRNATASSRTMNRAAWSRVGLDSQNHKGRTEADKRSAMRSGVSSGAGQTGYGPEHVADGPGEATRISALRQVCRDSPRASGVPRHRHQSRSERRVLSTASRRRVLGKPVRCRRDGASRGRRRVRRTWRSSRPFVRTQVIQAGVGGRALSEPERHER